MREWLQLALLIGNLVGLLALLGLNIYLTWQDGRSDEEWTA